MTPARTAMPVTLGGRCASALYRCIERQLCSLHSHSPSPSLPIPRGRRLGRKAQVPTPTHADIYDCLLPQEGDIGPAVGATSCGAVGARGAGCRKCCIRHGHLKPQHQSQAGNCIGSKDGGSAFSAAALQLGAAEERDGQGRPPFVR
jgi:hypothetical protein